TEPLGRGGGLRYAAAHLPHPDKPWYATNGDIWTRFSLREMADFHTERDATATLALARPRIPWGAVKTDGFGHVTDFIEAPPSAVGAHRGPPRVRGRPPRHAPGARAPRPPPPPPPGPGAAPGRLPDPPGRVRAGHRQGEGPRGGRQGAGRAGALSPPRSPAR